MSKVTPYSRCAITGTKAVAWPRVLKTSRKVAYLWRRMKVMTSPAG
jgi:hypothetical protein